MLDLARWYWQVPMDEDAKELTAFITPFGLYQFKVMPFGLSGAPATFQRLMDGVVRGMSGFTAAYLDNLVIFNQSLEEHVVHVRKVLGRLREAGLTAKPEECQMGMRKCAYLGYVVGGGEVRPQKDKVEADRRCEVP